MSPGISSEHPRPAHTDRPRPHALLSGGGSGGHVFPGLAVAEELTRRGWQVSWAGSRKGMEARLIGERGMPFFPLPAKPLVGQGLAGKVRATVTLAQAALKARSLVKRLNAKVVLGTGGYVSAPAVVGGRLASRPVLLLEPNAAVGFANRWLSRMASEAAVAYEATGGDLRCPITVTGIPIRREFFAVPELPASDPCKILVLGGSQGARQLNRLLPHAVRKVAELLPATSKEAASPKDKAPIVLPRLQVVHQTGQREVEETRQAYAAAGLLASQEGAPRSECSNAVVEVVPFIADVAAAMGESHLVISRAGAITLAEVCAAGRPTLLVPLTLAGGHQQENANRLAAAGAAEVLAADADVDSLVEILIGLVGDRPRLEAMSQAARNLGRAKAAERIADRVEHLGSSHTRGGRV